MEDLDGADGKAMMLGGRGELKIWGTIVSQRATRQKWLSWVATHATTGTHAHVRHATVHVALSLKPTHPLACSTFVLFRPSGMNRSGPVVDRQDRVRVSGGFALVRTNKMNGFVFRRRTQKKNKMIQRSESTRLEDGEGGTGVGAGKLTLGGRIITKRLAAACEPPGREEEEEGKAMGRSHHMVAAPKVATATRPTRRFDDKPRSQPKPDGMLDMPCICAMILSFRLAD